MPRPLPATAWAVLGILSFNRELSGYEVKQWADHSLTFFYWSPAVSQIYGELKRLEQLGFVIGHDAPIDEQRTRRVYRITDEGTTALTEWLEDSPVDPPVLKHAVLLRLWMGHLSTPDRLREVVERHRDHVDSVLEVLEKDRLRAAQEPDMRYPAMVLRWGERYYRNERELMDELVKELVELEGEAGNPPRSAR